MNVKTKGKHGGYRKGCGRKPKDTIGKLVYFSGTEQEFDLLMALSPEKRGEILLKYDDNLNSFLPSFNSVLPRKHKLVLVRFDDQSHFSEVMNIPALYRLPFIVWSVKNGR